MGPVGHSGGGGPAGCGWGFEADLIPAHRPMVSRTRMIHPIPIRRFTGFLGVAIQQASAACCDARGCGSSLLFVLARKLVSVAQYDLPLAVFTAVGLGAAQGPRLRLISGVTGHVLQIYGVGEAIAGDRHDILRGAIGGLDARGGPVEPRADLFPASFVTAERAHDHHVIGV